MKERAYNLLWRLGLVTRRALGATGLLHLRVGKVDLDAYLSRAAARLVPPPSGVAEVEVRLPSGDVLAMPPGLPVARTYRLGAYEPEVTALFQQRLRPGMTVVDVGAFVGYYTVLASRLPNRTNLLLEKD